MNKDSNETKLNEDENPPIFGSWNGLYIFVFLTFDVLVFLFYLFTKAFE